MFTDGIIDVTNESNERFGIERLEQILKNHSFSTAKEMKEAIGNEIKKFRGHKGFNDDVTCLATFIH